MSNNRIYLYVHAIWAVRERKAVLTRTIKAVLVAHLQKSAEEKGIHILQMNGGADHMHALLQLHPAQNLAQIVRQLKSESAEWLNATRIVADLFEWEDDYIAYTVSPNVTKQVSDYIDRQDAYHQSKSFDEELSLFDGMQASHD